MNPIAEVDTDHQHGPIVRVTFGDISVAVYVADETAVVVNNGNAYGIAVNGSWPEFRRMMRAALEGKP